MRPVVIGLTGSIGMGKSTTAQMFADFGIPVWSADDAVHRLYLPDGRGAKAIAAICPEAVGPDGVDRTRLSAWIAASPKNLERVEAAIHPLVRADREAFLFEAKADIAVVDIPLLFETGGENETDFVVVVSVPEEVQHRRVMERPGMTEEKLELILSKQLPDAEKRRRADFVVETTGLETARRAVQKIIKAVRGGQRHA